MPYTVHSLTPADLADWTNILISANGDPAQGRPGGEVMDCLWPNIESERGRELFQGSLSQRLAHPRARLRKAVDVETGRAVGAAIWVRETKPYQIGDIEEKWFDEGFSPDEKERDKGKEYARRVFSDLQGRRKRATEGCEGETVTLTSISVLPEYQRRGAASALMREGIEWADSLGAQVTVDGSTFARKLYQNFGFELVEEVTRPAPPSEWKGREAAKYDFRVRPAKGKSQA